MRTLVVPLAVLVGACAHDFSPLYRAVSAGHTGCEADTIQIGADANPMQWVATCDGKTFQCLSPKGVQSGIAACTAAESK